MASSQRVAGEMALRLPSDASMAPSPSVISHAVFYHASGYMKHVRDGQDDFSVNPGFKRRLSQSGARLRLAAE
jgi:hypothetical protein